MIGILQTGAPPRRLQPEWGGYGGMVAAMLGPDMPVRVYDVPGGDLPASPEACTGYVVTGSAAGVYDDLPWIVPLLDFLRAARGRSRLAGICFGHQAMAQAFGGTVRKSSKGWGVGLHRYDVIAQAPWMDGAGPLAVPAFHQDQVTALPPGAEVLARSAFTPYAMLRHGEDAMSVQFHPEFSCGFSKALVGARPEAYGALAEPAIRSFAQPSDAARAGGWIRRFLGGEPGVRP